MKYELFTFPNCSHCDEIGAYLEEKSIEYDDVNIGLRSGKKNPYWGHIYKTQELKRKDDESGDLIFPILGIFQDENVESLEKVVQGDEIKELF